MITNTIYNEDCIETMKKMPDNFLDLTVTSPPYDDIRTYEGNVGDVCKKFNDYSFDFESIAKQLYRTTKEGGVVVWVVGDAIIGGSESLSSFRQALYFKECGFNIHDTMIYEKAGPRFPEKIRYSQIFEYMFVISKGKPKTVNIIKDRKNKWAGHTNWGHGGHRMKDGKMVIKPKAKPYAEYGSRFNIWRYSNGFGFGTKDKDSYKHPAMFPEKLAGDHILSWSVEGDLVYDPFMGSGTTAKMAATNNRNYIGSEISSEYHKMCIERMKKYPVGIPVTKEDREEETNEAE